MFSKERNPSADGIWQYQEAKAKLSQVMDQVQEKGIQTIIRNRDEVYVVLTKEKFDEYRQHKDSLLDFFLSAPYPEVELDTKRSQELSRDVDL
jgi:prevent-host-death family protein